MKKRVLSALMLMLVLTGCTSRETVPPAVEITEAAWVETAVEVQTQPVSETLEPTLPPPVEKQEFVSVSDYIPEIRVKLKYASEDNFTGQTIYDFSAAYLRYGTVEKLALVQADLEELGMGLKIWDAYRPVAAQFALWEAVPDARYVADPRTGYSAHSRGNTVDVTLVDSQGRELVMPTGFDDFSAKADRDYSDCSQAEEDNALILELLMEKHGFKGYQAEWWHFTDGESYPVEQTFQP